MSNNAVRACAQLICLHDEADHRPEGGCGRCACTRYVGRWRMMARRAYWVLARGALTGRGRESVAASAGSPDWS